MAEVIRLTHEERNSPAWKKIKEWSEQCLVQLRINLEADQTPERTAKLRGQIRSLVLLQAMENPPTIVADEEPVE